MRVVLFCHSLLSEWHHGSAHFLRGVVSELDARGHEVRVFAPDGADHVTDGDGLEGAALRDEVGAVFPAITPIRCPAQGPDLEAALAGADLVLVHARSDPALVRRVGEHRARGASFRLFFHDADHRAAREPAALASFDLSAYDGVLAFGQSLAARYLERGWARRAFVWHEAVDTSVFFPHDAPQDFDVIWVGDDDDGERVAEIEEMLLGPARDLRLRVLFHSARSPGGALLAALSRAGVTNGGFLPDHRVPRALSRARVAVHVPRRPDVEALPGIPTIRPLEALACGIPMVWGPWRDTERLFDDSGDFLVAQSGAEMRRHLSALVDGCTQAEAMAQRGRWTLLGHHTCVHRVDELLAITAELNVA